MIIIFLNHSNAIIKCSLLDNKAALPAGLPKHSFKLAILDTSKGRHDRLLVSDVDGTLSYASPELAANRSWNRHQRRNYDWNRLAKEVGNEYFLRSAKCASNSK